MPTTMNAEASAATGTATSSFGAEDSSWSSSIIFKNAIWSTNAYESALAQYDAFASCTDSYIAPFITDALQTLDHAYRLYGPESVIGSFNGGKDAVVIMELIRAAHANYYRRLKKEQDQVLEQMDNDSDSDPNLELESDPGRIGLEIMRPRTIYFNNELEFPQVYQFVRNTVSNYDLDMIAFEEDIGFVGGLEILVHQNYVSNAHEHEHEIEASLKKSTRTHPMAFVLGTRAADPNAGNQGSFAPSSSWMPPFMRVNPILDWTYGHIWHFLRLYKLPYCNLYDEGYTSLGTVVNTLPCPALKKVNVTMNDGGTAAAATSTDDDDNSDCEFWPAYMLKDWTQERAGRIKKDKKKKKSEEGQPNAKNEVDKKKKIQPEDDTISRCSTVVSLPKEAAAAPVPVPAPSTSSIAIANKELKDDEKSEKFVPVNVDVESTPLDASLAGSDSIQRTVGIIIIGDEILKGMTPDTNTHAAATVLNANDVPLSRVVVVSDIQEDIVSEIQLMNECGVDVIITSGGVGPTHDDVTIKSVAYALGSEMVLNQDMAELLKSKMKKDDDDGNEQELTEAQIKMATLPGCAKLKYLSGIEGDWPVLQCCNIFILPGVPQFFETKVQHVASYLSTELKRSARGGSSTFKVVLSIDENSIVPILNTEVENHPHVSFGSYPFVDHPEAKTVVTLEGKRVSSFSKMDEANDSPPRPFDPNEVDLHVKVALSDLVNSLPDGNVLRVDNNNDLTFL